MIHAHESSSDDPFDVPGLIDRYLAGEATPAERTHVDAWASSDTERRAAVNSASMAATAVQSEMPRHDLDVAMRQVRLRVEQGTPHRARAIRDTTPWGVQPRARWGMAMALLLCVAGAGIAGRNLWHSSPVVERIAEREHVTRRGERARIELPDGSTVLLAPESRLRYAVNFGHATRLVELNGAALFTVPRSARVPFIVRTQGVDTRVLGTTFTVRRYTDDAHLRVVVAEGRVAIERKNAAPTVLGIGDEGILARDGRVVIHGGVDVASAFAWTQGRLKFSDTPLHDAAADISRMYGVDVRVGSPSIGARLVTGVVHDRMSVDDAVHMLAGILGVRAERRGHTIIFTE
jgi:transmembrane sensor